MTEDAERLRERLRLANAEYERMLSMADGWWLISAVTESRTRARCYIGWVRKNISTACCWRGRATGKGSPTSVGAIVLLPGRWTAPAFPLKAADFIARGVPKGPALGAALRAAEEAWMAAGFPMERRVGEDRRGGGAARAANWY